MMLSQCQHATGGFLLNGDCAFETLSTDTRSIRSGDVFIALRGDNFDAHDFLSQAQVAGACAVVVEQERHDISLPQLVVEDTVVALGKIASLKRNEFSGTLIAVTGSSGKTTVKGMLAAILADQGRIKVTQGNLNNQIGVPLTLMRLDHDDNFAVVELGTSARGEIGYLTALVRPQIALVNNVMPAHYAGFGSLPAIAQEKSAIYDLLQKNDTAVINLNDDFAQMFIDKTRASQQLGFSVGEPAAELTHLPSYVSATAVGEDERGCARFELSHAGESTAVQLPVIGIHNVSNALAAATCALAAHVPLQSVAEGLAAFVPERHRMQVCPTSPDLVLIDDTYNANPGSVRAAIQYLAGRPQTRVLVLGDLGELGDFAVQAHQEIGSFARDAGINTLVTCGTLSRHATETFGNNAIHFAEQPAAVEWLHHNLQPNSCILVKGSRSARMEKVVAALSSSGEQQ